MKNFQRATLACSASIIAALCIIAPASAATVAPASGPQIERVSETADIVFPQVDSSSISAPAAASISFERPAVKTIAAPPPVKKKSAPVVVAPQSVAAAPQAAAATSQVVSQAPVVARGAVQPQGAWATAPAPVAAPVAPVAPAPVSHGSGVGAGIVAAALSQIGVGQDCTALVSNSLRAVGINFHSAPAGYLSLGTVVSAAQAQPGDLVYYSNAGEGMPHIAVYIGGGQAVHGGWNGYTTAIATVYLGSGPTFIHVA